MTARLSIPPPRSHLEGTLALLDVLERVTGGHRDVHRLRDWLGHPEALPVEVASERNSLKYDAYLTRSREGSAWGLAVCDRYERGRLPWQDLVEALGTSYRLTLADDLLAALPAPASTTLGVGFDRSDRLPRLKVYLQEERWGDGLVSADWMRRRLAELAPVLALPDWMAPDQVLGVLTVEGLPDGSNGVKVYVGGPTPAAAASGAPQPVQDLADQMTAASILPGGWYYLTVRLRPGQPHRYALNRIYNPVQLGFAEGPPTLEDAWADVARQFRVAGQADALTELRAAFAACADVRVVPTATALEDGGRSVDVYVAAWALGAGR